uniref:Uncharacterized protein n=1 Tax=Arundo donax TaxID=35708 RepID=A0A0A9B7T9_ARUDO
MWKSPGRMKQKLLTKLL